MKAQNPIIRGMAPDPSICRCGDDYYMCNSSFSLFPGIPIFHSRDLCHWEKIGHAITRRSQLDFSGCRYIGGTYAPTMRYHNGRFYIINAFHSVNGVGYYIWADDPAGEWSDPVFGLDGGDPEIFFDDDGKSYLIGQCGDSTGALYPGDNEIFGHEIVDMDTLELKKGARMHLWNGALQKSVWLEGPHMYKINGMYYLMAAEGGTGEEHSVVIARSDKIEGPYEPCPFNPIVTHRHFGGEAPFHCTGHADLVEGANGRWYMVMLGTRRLDGYTFMDRETLIANVDWIKGWPCVNRGHGMVIPEPELGIEPAPFTEAPTTDLFKGDALGLDWVQVRALGKPYELTESGLKLLVRSERIGDIATPSLLLQRQKEFRFTFSSDMLFTPQGESECAGIVYFHSEEYYIRFEIGGDSHLRIVKAEGKGDSILYIGEMIDQKVKLIMVCEGLEARFGYIKQDGELCLIDLNVDMRPMSMEKGGGAFLGNLIGIYASSNGAESDNALFTSFTHLPGDVRYV